MSEIKIKVPECIKNFILCIHAIWRVTDIFWLAILFLFLLGSLTMFLGYLYKCTGYSPEMHIFTPLVLEWLIDGVIAIGGFSIVIFILHGIFVGIRKLCRNIYKAYKQLLDSICDEYKKLKEVSK